MIHINIYNMRHNTARENSEIEFETLDYSRGSYILFRKNSISIYFFPNVMVLFIIVEQECEKTSFVEIGFQSFDIKNK